MAVILAVQFYFNQRVQKDIVEEITGFSRSINVATDRHFQAVLNSYKGVQDEEKVHFKPDVGRDKFIAPVFEVESLYVEINEELLKMQDWEKQLKTNMQIQLDVIRKMAESSNFGNRVHEKNPKSPHNIWSTTENNSLKRKVDKKVSRYRSEVNWENEHVFKYHDIVIHPSGKKVQAIDINLNWFDEHPPRKIKDSPTYVKVNQNSKSPVISFQFPDYSSPGELRFLRYNYNTEQVNRTLAAMQNKSMLITAMLFLVSIFGIYFISRKFTNPIDSLKTAFQNVEKGNFDLPISSKTNDEIGELTDSFNHMVAELHKNREREKILQRKEKLASLGQLAAGVAHEIKNPLNAINLTIEHLHDKYTAPSDGKAREYIQTIQGEIRRLDKIVNNFLNFIRSENLQKTETDINMLLTEVLQLLEREIKSQNIELINENLDHFIHMIDSERFKTVFMNVILNAIQAMPDGGKLTITTDAKMKEIEISDTGTGISQKNLENIFDLFYTTKSSGTGLGLPTAYKIVKEHSGDIRIESEQRKGTTVRIFLSE
jgi:signal transduction histidine kinase